MTTNEREHFTPWHAMLIEAVRKYGSSPVVYRGDAVTTYDELEAHVQRCMRALLLMRPRWSPRRRRPSVACGRRTPYGR
jgi:hypothetical protein